MLYEVPDEVAETAPRKLKFLVDQLDLIGGVQFIFIEVCISVSLNLNILLVESTSTIITGTNDRLIMNSDGIALYYDYIHAPHLSCFFSK